MTFRMKLAERIIEVRPIYGVVREMCRNYIDLSGAEPEITVNITPEDIAREEAEAAKREQGPFSPSYLEFTAVHRKIVTALLPYNTFLMHGALLSSGGQGVMITAPSGTGKTTRAKLWTDTIPGSFVVNGDKPLLRVAEDTVFACGTPWCGKESWGRNTCVPLRAILILERSDTADSVERLSFAEAFPALLRQTFRPDGSGARRDTLRLLTSLSNRVRVYRFISRPTAEAVRLAWETVMRDTL